MVVSAVKKKLTAVGVSGAVVLALSCIAMYAFRPTDTSVCASTEETEDTLKVFIGDISRAPEDYVQQRTGYLKKLVSVAESVDAVIGFDDYYTVDEMTDLAEKYDITIDHVYMWPEGETGRMMLYVEDGDVKSAIDAYKQQIKTDAFCDDPQIAKDNQRFLDGEYGVFALTITATAEALEALNAEADCISYIDVMYNAEVEKYAKKVGKEVSYIELPSKPDGAL